MVQRLGKCVSLFEIKVVICFRCCRTDGRRSRVWAGERGPVRPAPAARCHQTSQNSRCQMPRVQCHVLPSADVLLCLQRVCLVRNILRHHIITLLITILVISPVFVHHRGLNKQGYQCRRESYFPFMEVWIIPSLSYISFLSSFCLLECNAAIHKKCIDKVIAKCTGSAINSKETMVCISCSQWIKLNLEAADTSMCKRFVNLWLWCLLIEQSPLTEGSLRQTFVSFAAFIS